MNKISAIKISRKELNDLLKVLTEEGKLIGLYEENENWEDSMAFVHSTEEYLDEDKTKELLANHIKTCVMNDIKEGNEETMDELLEVLKKLMK